MRSELLLYACSHVAHQMILQTLDDDTYLLVHLNVWLP